MPQFRRKQMARRSRRQKKKFQKRMSSSQKAKNGDEQEAPADRHSKPADEPDNSRTIIKSVIVQPSPKDDQHRKAEQQYWDTQIRHAKILNWITGVATGMGLLSLYFLNATLNQTAVNLKIQQRAYVAVAHDGVEFVGGSLKPGQPIQINIRYKNTGLSPATDVATPNGIAVGPRALAQVKKIPLSSTPKSRGVVVPDGSGITTTVAWPPLTKDEFDTFMKGATIKDNIHIVVFGSIHYRDIFNDPHETEYCYRFLTGGLWSYCAEHNKIN